MNQNERKLISRFLADFALTAEYAAANPDDANRAWDTFRNDYGLDADQLKELRINAVKVRLGEAPEKEEAES
jgi:hypothetical protein